MNQNLRFSLVTLLLFIAPVVCADNVFTEGKSAQGESIGENVTLRFEIQGFGEEFVVVTARQNYRISSNGNVTEEHGAHVPSGDDENLSTEADAHTEQSDAFQKQEEHQVELTGTVERGSNSDKMLVTCMGAIHVVRVEEQAAEGDKFLKSDEISLEIDISAFVKPGEKTLLVQAGKHALHVTVDADK